MRRESEMSIRGYVDFDGPEWPHMDLMRKCSYETPKNRRNSFLTADPFDFDGRAYQSEFSWDRYSDDTVDDSEESTRSCTSAECARTIMIRNLSRITTPERFLEALDDSGFANTYDFAYLPYRAVRFRNLGFAFVNFKTSQSAQSFYEQWHRSNAFLRRGKKSRHITISTAIVQGKDENIRLIEESCIANKGCLDHKPVAFVDGTTKKFGE